MVCEKSVSASLTLWKAGFPTQHPVLRLQNLTAVTSSAEVSHKPLLGNEGANVMFSVKRVRIYYGGSIIDNDHFYFGAKS